MPPEILVRNKAADELVEQFIAMWRKAKPHEFAEYLELLKEQQRALWTPSGRSQGGTLGWKGCIPVPLYAVLERHCPGYLRDPRNLMHIHKHVMGDYMPKASNNFHYIDRRQDVCEPPETAGTGQGSTRDS